MASRGRGAGSFRGRELLFSLTRKDFEISWFSGTGAGGQYRNRHMNCCRIRHPASGAMATGQSHRERQANLKEAMKGLVNSPRFRSWHAGKVDELTRKGGKSPEEVVEEMMRPENLKVESRGEDGRWVPYEDGGGAAP